MLSVVAEPATLATPRPKPSPQVVMREELDRLNDELRELRSTDYAVRAYIETWLAVVAGLATTKLVYDWHHTHGKPPVIAIPIAGLALLLLADSLVQRFKQRFIATDEERRLLRQRELRRLLRVDEIDMQLDPEPIAKAG
jgi:hypothetical protein